MAPSFDSPALLNPFRAGSRVQKEVMFASGVDEETLVEERKALRRHLGLGETPGDLPLNAPEVQPLFFIEKAPDSKAGAGCALPGCTHRIEPKDLRLALNPGMRSENWYRASSDFYHLRCFEKIADFSDANFLDRVVPLTRYTYTLRGVKASSVLDGHFLVPGGIERLVLEWKKTRGRWIDKRDGVYDEWKDRSDSSFDELLCKAGSSTYTPRGRPANVDNHEYYILSQMLAPYESDGPNDENEWNLFAEYLDSRVDRWNNPHDLSEMLEHWEADVMLARDTKSLGAKCALEEKTIRALRRLSAIPTPQVGFNRLYFE